MDAFDSNVSRVYSEAGQIRVELTVVSAKTVFTCRENCDATINKNI